MRYGIIGDIHANYEALTAVLAECEKLKVAKYFCIGDIVGYNADRREVLFVESWAGMKIPRRMCAEEMAATAYLTFYFKP